MDEILRIERPATGDGYLFDWYGVYEYSVHPEGSPLAGQVKRTLLGMDRWLDSAKESTPCAEWSGSKEKRTVSTVIEYWEGRRPSG